MAPAGRSSSWRGGKDQRRACCTFKVAVYTGVFAFTCFFLAFFELGRNGYLTGSTGIGQQFASMSWLQTPEQEGETVSDQLVVPGRSDTTQVDNDDDESTEGVPGEPNSPSKQEEIASNTQQEELQSNSHTKHDTNTSLRGGSLEREEQARRDPVGRLEEENDSDENGTEGVPGEPNSPSKQEEIASNTQQEELQINSHTKHDTNTSLGGGSLERREQARREPVGRLEEENDSDGGSAATKAPTSGNSTKTPVELGTDELKHEHEGATVDKVLVEDADAGNNNIEENEDSPEEEESTPIQSKDGSASSGAPNMSTLATALDYDELLDDHIPETVEAANQFMRAHNMTTAEYGNKNEKIEDLPVCAPDLLLNATKDNVSMSKVDWNIPRMIPRTWTPPKPCATAEEMGAATTGDTKAASLRVRALIQKFVVEHGAERVGKLPGDQFCKRGFVLAQAQEDGFGNNMYKVLTNAGLAVMLNRSLIIAERGSANPAYIGGSQVLKPAFGEYLDFSNQTFSVREVKRLWAVHGCVTKHNRPLVIYSDQVEKGFRCTRCLCDDWTKVRYPIIHFKGAIGSGVLQLLLKNAHPAMRSAAAELLGNPAIPSSRPNTFGELFRTFIAPNPEIQEAVNWALRGGPDPDVALHLRMLHSRTRPAPASASNCIHRIVRRNIDPKLFKSKRRPRVVVVTDTPDVIPNLQRSLGQGVELVRFDYQAYLKSDMNRSEVMSLDHGVPPRKRIKDWGAMPRWVAMVDFFLAARARVAVVSGAYRRVSTTYAQLVASLAAAYTLQEDDIISQPSFAYYTSFQPHLVSSGLASQSGWGFTWRPFGGKLGCRNQVAQCALTALMPYAWWDAPWQSPISADIRKVQPFAGIDSSGQVSERQMDKYCEQARRRSVPLTRLVIPNIKQNLTST